MNKPVQEDKSYLTTPGLPLRKLWGGGQPLVGWPWAQPAGRTVQALVIGVPLLRFESCLQRFCLVLGARPDRVRDNWSSLGLVPELCLAFPGAGLICPELPGRMEMFSCWSHWSAAIRIDFYRQMFSLLSSRPVQLPWAETHWQALKLRVLIFYSLGPGA